MTSAYLSSRLFIPSTHLRKSFIRSGTILTKDMTLLISSGMTMARKRYTARSIIRTDVITAACDVTFFSFLGNIRSYVLSKKLAGVFRMYAMSAPMMTGVNTPRILFITLWSVSKFHMKNTRRMAHASAVKSGSPFCMASFKIFFFICVILPVKA